MAKKCRVCNDEETIGNRMECENCWYFYHRAFKKFEEKRGIKINFDDVTALAQHIRDLYRANKYCCYTGLELMLGERAKEARLKELRNNRKLSQILNKEETKELEDLEQYKRALNVLALSIDRKISKIGEEKLPYDKSDNTVLCIRAINIMKTEFEPDEFLQACFQVLAYQVEKGTDYADDVLSMIRNFNAKHIN